jgi:hypothetical protein
MYALCLTTLISVFILFPLSLSLLLLLLLLLLFHLSYYVFLYCRGNQLGKLANFFFLKQRKKEKEKEKEM